MIRAAIAGLSVVVFEMLHMHVSSHWPALSSHQCLTPTPAPPYPSSDDGGTHAMAFGTLKLNFEKKEKQI